MTIRLAVLGSTRGTNLQAIIDAVANHTLDASVEIVISNKTDAFILQRASEHGIPAQLIPVNGQSREAYDRSVHTALQQYRIDLIVMVGYMRIVSQWLTEQWPNKIINVHPSLLPKHAGLMDLAAHQAAIDAGDSESGCTVHFVNEIVDGGQIMTQKRCTIALNETAESLKKKVQALEGPALIQVITDLAKALL